jgi:hypothetical protein
MNNNINNNRTPAGFNTEKMTADAVADLVYQAASSLSTANSLLIETYKLGDKTAEKVQKNIDIRRKMLLQLWEYINKEMRHIND